MEDSTQKESLTAKIIASARDGRLKMRPKWYFILRAVLWIAGTALVLLFLLYFASLFAFILRKTGILAAPVFGWHGVFVFLTSIPWLLVLVMLFFVAVLEILVQRYSFAYRLPLLYSALAILLAVWAASLVIDRTPFHRILSDCSSAGTPPAAGGRRPMINAVPCAMGFYRDLGPKRFDNVNDGVITRIIDPDLIIINRQQESLTVLVTPRTRLPFGSDFSVGDAIVIIGDRRGDKITAFGISFLADWERQKKQ